MQADADRQNENFLYKHLHLTDLREARRDGSITDHLLMKIADLYRRHPRIERFKVAMPASNFFGQAMVFQRALKPITSVLVFANSPGL